MKLGICWLTHLYVVFNITDFEKMHNVTIDDIFMKSYFYCVSFM